MTNAIEVRDLVKKYNDRSVVDGVSFECKAGTMFSLLGQNGAGKSTTIGMISTAISKDKGGIWVNGHEVGKDNTKIRGELGIVFQQNVLDELLTVQENIDFRAKLFQVSDAEKENSAFLGIYSTVIFAESKVWYALGWSKTNGGNLSSYFTKSFRFNFR